MQTNQISSKEKSQSLRLDDSDQKNNHGKNETKEEKKKDPKPKEKRYWEPLIPRSDTKDRLEIW